MFKKVIVAEDLDPIFLLVDQILEGLSVKEVCTKAYCDDALLEIKKAKAENNPFELLITDLSFKERRHNDQLGAGEELIAAAKKYNPEIKIIVYSIEDKLFKIRSLFEKYGIDAYVIKGNKSIPKLSEVIESVYRGEKQPIPTGQDKELLAITPYDIEILKRLAKGLQIDEIAAQFQMEAIKPHSQSSIEKNVSKLRDYFRASNNVQLIALAKDFGLL
ncbi:MAG TPA: hypothetical protein VK528_07185 [Flavobacterium sp.]|nr:hypothetical protein [Flavobacterium sp.]